MMKEEIAEKVMKKKSNKGIPQYKKVWYSITKFESYPEMAAEGTPKAFKYLLFLSLITSIIISIFVTIQIGKVIKNSIKMFNENISTVVYEDGILQAELVGENKIENEFGTLIVDTGDITKEKVSEYEGSITSSRVGIIWLKDHVAVRINGKTTNYRYKDTLDELQIKSFDKETLLKFLNEKVNSFNTYLFYFFSEGVILFVTFFISTLADILILSIFGVLTALITKISLRYRAIFNMSTYAITLSALLQTLYRIVQIFTNFQIKYFDLMYTAISYICLTAAIFMIRSDVIKQQIELIRLREEKENQETEKKDEEEKEKEEIKKEEEEKKEDNQEETEKEAKKEEKQGEITGESEGSNA